MGGFTGFISDILLNTCRIRNACRVLAESDYGILEIALSCGFQNLANFNRQFRKATGMPPREYRKLRNRH